MSAKVHLHLHVSDLAKSREFYEKFLGTGPVKGFAVTLMIGIAVSLFTAVFFTRLLFDLIYMGQRKRETLSI